MCPRDRRRCTGTIVAEPAAGDWASATARDRVAQASLKLMLEPIFEADFKAVQLRLSPQTARPDAIAEIHYFGST